MPRRKADPERVLRHTNGLREMLNTQATTPTIYSQVMKRSKGGDRAYFRFLVVWDGQIMDETPAVGTVADMGTLKDCGDYWAIVTHPTNAQDIVQMVSRRIYGNDNAISHRRL